MRKGRQNHKTLHKYIVIFLVYSPKTIPRSPYASVNVLVGMNALFCIAGTFPDGLLM